MTVFWPLIETGLGVGLPALIMAYFNVFGALFWVPAMPRYRVFHKGSTKGFLRHSTEDTVLDTPADLGVYVDTSGSIPGRSKSKCMLGLLKMSC